MNDWLINLFKHALHVINHRFVSTQFILLCTSIFKLFQASMRFDPSNVTCWQNNSQMNIFVVGFNDSWSFQFQEDVLGESQDGEKN